MILIEIAVNLGRMMSEELEAVGGALEGPLLLIVRCH